MNTENLTLEKSKDFYCNLPLYIEQKTEDFKKPITDIEDILNSTIPILAKLTFYDFENEKLIKNIWDKTEIMKKEIFRMKNHLYENPVNVLNFPNTNYNIDFEHQIETYNSFVHDIGNPLSIIGGYSKNILSNINQIMPDSNRKYILEDMFETIFNKTKYIGENLNQGNINTYLN